MENSNILIITPHPDDAEFGVAGTVVKWIAEGRQVIYAVCTNGNKGSDDPAVTPAQLATTREKEQRAACKLLSVKEVIFLNYDDQTLEDTPEFRKQIVRLIRTYKPKTVVTSDPYRKYWWHRDHRITGQVVLDAVFPFARDRLAYPDLLEEGLEPHKVREILLWGAEQPNYIMDITDTFETKLEALRCHRSQVGDLTGDLEKFIRQRHANMAAGQPFNLAESFYRVDIWR